MHQLLKFWWISLFIKLIISNFLPFFHDEAYYWFWGDHLQLSYYDHPPFVAWLFYIGRMLSDYSFLTRWPAILLGHGTILIWLFIAKDYLSKEKLKIFFWLALLFPLTGIGSLIVTPDIPLNFLWSLTLLVFIRYIQKPSIKLSSVFGLLIGIGFCAKYNMALFVPFALVYLLFTKNFKALSPQYIFLGVFSFILGASPVFIWNFQNDFISFAFQLDHGIGGKVWQPKWTLLYLLGQFLLMTPFIFYSACKKFDRTNVFTFFALLPLLFFLLTSFKGHVEGNWPLVAHLPLVFLASKSISKKIAASLVIFWGTISLFLIYATMTNQFSHMSWARKLIEPHEYRALAEKSKDFDQPIFARSYQMASQLSFYTKRNAYKLKGYNRKDFFDFLPQSIPQGDFVWGTIKRDWLPNIYKENFIEDRTLQIDDVYQLRLVYKK